MLAAEVGADEHAERCECEDDDQGRVKLGRIRQTVDEHLQAVPKALKQRMQLRKYQVLKETGETILKICLMCVQESGGHSQFTAL